MKLCIDIPGIELTDECYADLLYAITALVDLYMSEFVPCNNSKPADEVDLDSLPIPKRV
jgi:hypothetical protein